MIKRLFAVLLAAIILIASVSCGNDKIAMSYGNVSVDERMYRYWATQYKEYILEAFGAGNDSAGFWNTEVADGLTMAEYADQIAITNIKKNLVCMKLFDDYNLKLTDIAVASIQSDMRDLLDAYGSRAELNSDLARYGVNDKILERIYEIQEEISAVFEHLYGVGGLFAPTNEQLEDYYKENYARIKYITILLYKNIETDDQRTSTISLTNEELIEKNLKVDEIIKILDEGADFDEVFIEYNEYDMTGYEDGVYVSKNNSGYDIIAQALAMKIGEVKLIEQQSAIYIVKRYDLPEKPYLDDKMGQFSDLGALCADELFQNRLTELSNEIIVNDDIISRYPVKNMISG